MFVATAGHHLPLAAAPVHGPSQVPPQQQAAQKIASKRSGQRGHTARQALLTAEAELASIQSQDPQVYVAPKIANDLMKEVFDAYEALEKRSSGTWF